jgi:ParB/RepB/Spo0J family partition protein
MPKMTFIKLMDLIEAGDIDSRKHGKDDGVDELMFSIKWHGLLQSLVVRPAANGNYEVIDGNRRFRALKQLHELGEIKNDFEVPVLVREADDRDAAEMSLAANIVRLPLHPVDQYRAFAAIIGEGKTPADIAASFGIAEKTVRKRMALGNIHPPVLEAAIEKNIDNRVLIAFASAPLDLQIRAWEKYEAGEVELWAMGRLLHTDTISGDSVIAQVVGEDAYLRAGGSIEADLFSEDEDTFWTDTELANKLYWQVIDGRVEALQAEGKDAMHFKDPRVTDTDSKSGWWQRIWDEKDYPADTELTWLVQQDAEVVAMIWRGYQKTEAPKPKEEEGLSAALKLTLDQQLTEATILALAGDAKMASALMTITMAQKWAHTTTNTSIQCVSTGCFEHRPEDVSKLTELVKRVQKLAGKLLKSKTLKTQVEAFNTMDFDEKVELQAGLIALSMRQVYPQADILTVLEVNPLTTFAPDATYFSRLKKGELLEIAAKESIAIGDGVSKAEIVRLICKDIRADWVPDYLSAPKPKAKTKKAA